MIGTIRSYSFWLAVVMTLICAVIGTFLAQLPYLSLFGALIIALILGMYLQASKKLVNQASGGIAFI